jgi:hypothetical protein
MRLKNLFLAACTAALCVSAPAIAQIEIDQLSPASAYDSGILDGQQGALDSALWQGTSAARAVKLIDAIDSELSPVSRSLVRAALLSGGVPPQADDGLDREAYTVARFKAVLAAGNMATFDELAARNNLSESEASLSKIFTEKALLAGHTDKACSLTDSVTQDRRAPYWSKIRAYCHYLRDETPAAETTADILRRGGHSDDAFFSLIGGLTGASTKKPELAKLSQPLHIAMARDYLTDHPKQKYSVDQMPAILAAGIALSDEVQSWDRWAALKASAHILSAEQVGQVLNGLSDEPLQDLEALKNTSSWTSAQWGQAATALRTSIDIDASATLAAEIFKRAEKAGILEPVAKALANDISIIPATFLATEAPGLFARIAVMNNDLSALGAIYQTLPEDDDLRGRIALASDALGGGFIQSALGTDIETRLVMSGSAQKRAIRDTHIAAALGANLPDAALDAMTGRKSQASGALPSGSLLALRAVAKRGSKAEAALMAASLIGNKPLTTLRDEDLAALLAAFTDAGMYQTAGRIAAADFISGIN